MERIGLAKYMFTCKHCEVKTLAERLLRCPICGSADFSYELFEDEKNERN
jgi:RNA polymerase subunit RPABC4/transcription elongation factor Spt4